MEEKLFDTERFGNSGITLVDFWASWCGPCKMQAPILEEFAKAHPEVKVVKVNVDEEGELAVKVGINVIPTLVVLKDGEVAKTEVGLHNLNGLEALVAACNG